MPDYVPIQDLTIAGSVSDNDLFPMSDGSGAYAVRGSTIKSYSASSAVSAAADAAASKTAAQNAATAAGNAQTAAGNAQTAAEQAATTATAGLSALEAKVLTKYTGTAPTNSVKELPDNCWWLASGATMTPLLGPNFIWTLNGSNDYIIRVYRVAPTMRRYEFGGAGNILHWGGYILNSQTNITWYTDITDTGLTISGRAADSKVVGDNILLHYTGAAPTESIKELPTNSWWTAYGSEMEALLGPNFIWGLTASSNYIVTKQFVVGQTYRYTLGGVGSPSCDFTGWSLQTGDIHWKDNRVEYATGGGIRSAKLLGYGHSTATGSVWTLHNGVPAYDHLVTYDNAPYSGYARGLGVRQENVDYTLISSGAFMSPIPDHPENGTFLSHILATNLSEYDYVLAQLAHRDIRDHLLGDLNSTAGDGTVVGGILTLLNHISTCGGLCQPIVISVVPCSLPSAGAGSGVFDYVQRSTSNPDGTSIKQLDAMMRQIAEREHFVYVTYADMALSYHWQDYTCDGNNYHFASDAPYRIMSEYIARAVVKG